MAEDPLEAEDIAPVHKERPGERVAQDVGRTARLQLRAGSEAVDKLIQASRSQWPSARPAEERIVGPVAAAMGQPDAESLARSSTDRNNSLPAALPEHATPTLDEVQIADPKSSCFADANAGVQQQQDDSLIALRIARALSATEQSQDLRVAQAGDKLLGDARERHGAERVRGQVELARDPGPESLEGADAPSEAARRQLAGPRLEREQPTANNRSLKVTRGGCRPIPLSEADELKQEVAIPLNRPRTPTGDLERAEVLVDQIPQTDLAELDRRRDGYGSHAWSSR